MLPPLSARYIYVEYQSARVPPTISIIIIITVPKGGWGKVNDPLINFPEWIRFRFISRRWWRDENFELCCKNWNAFFVYLSGFHQWHRFYLALTLGFGDWSRAFDSQIGGSFFFLLVGWKGDSPTEMSFSNEWLGSPEIRKGHLQLKHP